MMKSVPHFLLLLILPWKVLFYFLKAVCLSMVPYPFRRKKDIAGEIVLVTGGGSGIGASLVRQLAKTGATVVILDVNESNAEKLKEEVVREGGIAWSFFCDVSNREQVYEVAAWVRENVGNVSILINNAGTVNGAYFMDVPDDDLTKILNVNVLGNFWTVKAFLPHMLSENRGHLVTIGSVAGYAGLSRLADYCATKAAIISFHESLALEIKAAGKENVCLTLVCPYLTATGLFAGARSRYPFFVPILNPDYLAKRILRSIVLEERHLIVPGIMRLLLPLYRILPIQVLESSDDIFGAYSCMEKFVGHNF